MPPLVRFDRVAYRYPRTETFALLNLSLKIRAGEWLGVIGPTGAGKTTLCLTLNGIVPQFYGGQFFGRVTVAGLDTLETPVHALARHVGMVFEDVEMQLTAVSVEREVAFALENLGLPRDEIRARIPDALQAVRLESMAHKHPHELSGGQKQRLAIAAALALHPDLLVLDEPTAQLDPVGRQEIFATLRELNRTLGLTVVMTGHAAEEMATFCHRLILLDGGRIVAEGPPDTIYGDVALLARHHLRPPQVTRTFALIGQRLGTAAPPPLPVTLTAGTARLRRLHDEGRWEPPTPADPPAPSGDPLLVARHLHHTYTDGTVALRDVSLEVRSGEYLLIIGQNGAGKSTLVKHFLRLLEPTRGSVCVAGRDTREYTVAELARQIGYVAQNPDHQLFNATVEDEVAFALRAWGLPAAEITARTEASLTMLELEAVRHRHPFSLPKGLRARVVIAAILAMQPRVLIFDEPTTGQDDRGARRILEISHRLHMAGKTIIVITHHLHLMPGYARRVVVMGKGQILLDAPLRRAYHALEILQATHVTPPQAVRLSRAVAPTSRLLTPEEIAQGVQR